MEIHERIRKWLVDDGVSLFQNMNLPKSAICVDFGAGCGEYSIALALSDKSSKVYAVDINPKMLEQIRTSASMLDVENIRLLSADVTQKTELADSFVDIVLMYDLIHGNDSETKLPLRFHYFEEASRILKPNGILSIAPFKLEN